MHGAGTKTGMAMQRGSSPAAMAEENTMGTVVTALGACGAVMLAWTMIQLHSREQSGRGAVDIRMHALIAQKATKSACTETSSFGASVSYPVLVTGSVAAVVASFVGILVCSRQAPRLEVSGLVQALDALPGFIGTGPVPALS